MSMRPLQRSAMVSLTPEGSSLFPGRRYWSTTPRTPPFTAWDTPLPRRRLFAASKYYRLYSRSFMVVSTRLKCLVLWIRTCNFSDIMCNTTPVCITYIACSACHMKPVCIHKAVCIIKELTKEASTSSLVSYKACIYSIISKSVYVLHHMKPVCVVSDM